MTAITQCPSCGTLFRVVEDQLRISQGWVRCGQCHHVFDAQLSLRGEADIHTRVADVQGGASVSEAQLPQLDRAPWVDPLNPDVGLAVAGAEVASIDEAVVSPSPSVTTSQPTDTSIDFAPAVAAASTRDMAEMPQVSFIQQPAPVPSRWVAWAWGFAALVLTACLLAQLAWQERSRLAAHYPSAEPVLTAVCASVGCKVDPLRAIDAVVIDSFAITELGTAGYRLTFNLRSNAHSPIAAPSVELSLQDAQEQTVLKRVFGPSDFGLLKPTMSSNSEHAANVIFTLREPNGTPVKRIAGYRLFAFYP